MAHPLKHPARTAEKAAAADQGNPPFLSKARCCALHLSCIVLKLALRKKVHWRWHWQHTLREFGYGIYTRS